MALTVAVLQQQVQDRRMRQTKVDRLPLGRGFFIEVYDGATLVVTSQAEPGASAVCGFVEATVRGTRWMVYQEWYDQLVDTFGWMPDRVAVEGEAA